MAEFVNLMDITDRNGTARSSVLQRRKTPGEGAVRELFDITQRHWNQQANHPEWHGLNLFAVDGVVWRTADTPENSAAFSRHAGPHGESGYPQARMVCLMELSSHLINASAFDSENISEMRLAAHLTEKTPDNSIKRCMSRQNGGYCRGEENEVIRGSSGPGAKNILKEKQLVTLSDQH